MNQSRLRQLLRWVSIDATTGREAVLLCTIESDLAAEGWRATHLTIPGCDTSERYNLLFTRSGNAPRVLMCTHSDTVPPHLPSTMEGDTIRGRGACDTKGVFLAMVEAAAKLGHPDDLGLLLVAGEEVDHCGADAFSTAPPWRPERIILGEPTRSQVVTGQKGVLKLRATTTGQEGHSAFPGRGHSAIHTLLDALHRLRALTLPSHDDLGHSTLNVGLMQGGVAANVFAPSASAVLMIRATAPTAELERAVTEAMGDEVSLEILSRCEPQVFDVPDGFSTTVIPFNSDAAWLSRVAPVWLAGPGDIRLAHSIEERISLEELTRGVGLYTALYRAAVSG